MVLPRADEKAAEGGSLPRCEVFVWDATSDPERSPQLRAIAAAGGVDCILCVFTLVRVRVCMTHARRPGVAATWHWRGRYCCGGRIHLASADGATG